MNEKPFLWMFYIFPIIFAFDEFYLRFSYLSYSFQSLLIFPLVRLPFYHSIMGIYIGLYFFYLIIKYYERLKKEFYDKRLNWLRKKLLDKDKENPRDDLYRFMITSLLISFFADLFFASVRTESIFKLIPGLELIDNVLTQSPNYPATVTVSQLLTAYGYAPGPPIGALTIFLLRQIRYKYKDTDDYPGSRILLCHIRTLNFVILANIQNSASSTASRSSRIRRVYYYSQTNHPKLYTCIAGPM